MTIASGNKSNIDFHGVVHRIQSAPASSIKDDNQLKQLVESDDENLSQHNDLYTKLLRFYVSHIVEVNQNKLQGRKWFNGVAIIILIAITMLTVGVVVWSCWIISTGVEETKELAAVISVLLADTASIVSAYMVLPKIVINYLFNKDEEKSFTDIIANIQNYDSKIRENKKQ